MVNVNEMKFTYVNEFLGGLHCLLYPPQEGAMADGYYLFVNSHCSAVSCITSSNLCTKHVCSLFTDWNLTLDGLNNLHFTSVLFTGNNCAIGTQLMFTALSSLQHPYSYPPLYS